MSNTFVRTTIAQFLTTNFSAEKQIELDAEDVDLETILSANGVDMGNFDPWLGLQYSAGEEEPITVPATNTTGRMREPGSIALHAVEKSGLGARDKIQPRLTALMNKFRNQSLGNDSIKILRIIPPNYSTGATLDLQGGYTSGTIYLSYEYTFDLPVTP